MKFFGPLVLILATLFFHSFGRTVEEGTENLNPAKSPAKGNGSKGLLWPQFCKNDSIVYDNVFVCILCRGFSRLCFTMTNSGYGSKPTSSSDSKPSSTGGSSNGNKPPTTKNPGGEETTTEPSGKAI